MGSLSITAPPIKRTVTAAQIFVVHQNHSQTWWLGELAEKGVAKGTVSKIKTVLEGLEAKVITTDQVTSLNAAYELIKKPGKGTLNLTTMDDLQLITLTRKIAEELEARSVDKHA